MLFEGELRSLMAKKVQIAKASPDAYNAVVDIAELLDVKLIKTDFEIRASYFSTDQEKLKFVYKCDLVAKHFSPDDGRLIGTFEVEAGAKYSRQFLLRSRAHYVIAFEILGAPEENAALTYLSRVGAFGIWPYFRSHFAHLCGSAGAEAPPLPIMRGNLPKKVQAEE